jgi:beta-glucosidase/6-phospho-beta-glucosidase/beta-galactosidase
VPSFNEKWWESRRNQASTKSESTEDRIVHAFKRNPSFFWGTATAAYQVEGAWDKDGRHMSIGDHFAHDKGHGHVYKDETGDKADEFDHRWKEDIERLDEFGFNAFRLSIAWPRIFPKGEDGGHRANPIRCAVLQGCD